MGILGNDERFDNSLKQFNIYFDNLQIYFLCMSLSSEMLNLTTRLCWKLVQKEGYIAMWQKPLNNSCYLGRDAGTNPPLCDPDDDPDNVW